MTTFRLVYLTVMGLADHGHRLPATERLAWRTLTVRLQELADHHAASVLAWQAPADYAERVRALHDQLTTADPPAAPLAARWVSGWLADHADHAAAPRSQVPTLVLAPAPDPAARSRPRAAGARRWGAPLPGIGHRAGLPPRPGWAVLLVSDVTLLTPSEHWGLATLSSAVELTCAADRRPWQWRPVGSQFQMHIGPPPAIEHPPARQVADDLEHLASGLNPGSWRVSALARPSSQHRPER
jgi:hypothetical protein